LGKISENEQSLNRSNISFERACRVESDGEKNFVRSHTGADYQQTTDYQQN